MQRLKTILGYSGAALSLAMLLAAPVLFGLFSGAIAATGVQVDPIFGGGPVAQVLARAGYHIDVHRPVLPRALADRSQPFVQLVWSPASALPKHVDEEVDIDQDGQPDLRVQFDVPADPLAPLVMDITPLNPRVRAASHVSRDRLWSLIARVNDTVVVRATLEARPPR